MCEERVVMKPAFLVRIRSREWEFCRYASSVVCMPSRPIASCTFGRRSRVKGIYK